jgi:hypothetical protein
MELENSMYHKCLRVTTVIVAFVLMFVSGVVTETSARLSLSTQSYLANAVGVFVGVPENDVNRLTTRIAELEAQVVARDEAIRERDLAIGLQNGAGSTDTATYVLSGILFILLVLIVLNYALDFVRYRQTYARFDSSSSLV